MTKKLEKIGIIVISVIMISLCIFAFMQNNYNVNEKYKEKYERLQSEMVVMKSAISYDSRRSITMSFMRTEIGKINPNLDYETIAKLVEYFYCSAETFNQDPWIAFSIAAIESGFDSKAVSPKEAYGICQIIKPTAISYCDPNGYVWTGVDMLFDPKINIHLSNKMIRDWLVAYDNNMDKMLAHYNGGNSQAYYWDKDKNKMYAETFNYVTKVSDLYKKYQKTYLN